MTHDLWLLTVTAASVGFIHTLIGPDHYLPFVMMSRAGKWSRAKTFAVTILCGIGHVGSSVLLGAIGIALGVALRHLQIVESVRGEIAAWALFSFGVLYLLWGLRRAWLNKPHTHVHLHDDGTAHEHTHTHHDAHAHPHEARSIMTAWALFTVFVLGPCEPLIPILMYPAAQKSAAGLIWVTSVFGIVTIGTMSSMVFLMLKGISFLPAKALERYTHALAGGVIALTGLLIQVFGL
jgi:sulfite exporter TauE/SafE